MDFFRKNTLEYSKKKLQQPWDLEMAQSGWQKLYRNQSDIE